MADTAARPSWTARVAKFLFWVVVIALAIAAIPLNLWWNGPLICAHFGRFC